MQFFNLIINFLVLAEDLKVKLDLERALPPPQNGEIFVILGDNITIPCVVHNLKHKKVGIAHVAYALIFYLFKDTLIEKSI